MNKVIYEYSILRYVPDLERGEFVNVGLIMMCKRQRWIRSALNVDHCRILALSPSADLECLVRQLSAFEGCDIPDSTLPVEERYRWMVAAKSAIIQCSPSHPGILLLSENVKYAQEPRATIVDHLNLQFDHLFRRLC